MAACPQTTTQSVLDHGYSVWSYTQKILNKDVDDFKIPDWLQDNYDEIIANVHHHSIIEEYNVLHDCGKPYCLTIDEEGKRHFPNHAEVSKQTYKSLPVGNVVNADIVANLIGWDMVLHTATADEIQAMNFSKQDIYTLLVTALAEIHSNANMFGGLDSVSFKSKWKKLDRRGNMIVKGFNS
jgi:hypothetical protein